MEPYGTRTDEMNIKLVWTPGQKIVVSRCKFGLLIGSARFELSNLLIQELNINCGSDLVVLFHFNVRQLFKVNGNTYMHTSIHVRTCACMHN